MLLSFQALVFRVTKGDRVALAVALYGVIALASQGLPSASNWNLKHEIA
jgi:hypothetical protein